MGRSRKFLGFLGLMATITAFTAAMIPGLFPREMLSTLLQEKIFLYVVMALLAIYAVLSLRKKGFREGRLFLKQDNEPELVQEQSEGLKLDLDGLEANQDIFRDTVREVLMEEKGLSDEEADQKLEAGSWTEDRVSAAYVDENVNYPIIERLRDWLEDRRTEKRRAENTVKSIEKLHRGNKDGK